VRSPLRQLARHLPFVVLAGAWLAPPVLAAEPSAGRWEGTVDIPGAPMRLVVDLARDDRGTWMGSVILPGRGVKGAALDALVVSGEHVAFGLAAAFAGAAKQAPQVALDSQPDGSLAGSFSLGGQTAGVLLRRSGAAQLDRPPASTAISAGLEGRWRGRYELGGVPRQVTLTLANRGPAGAAGQLVIVGKRTTTLDVDLVVQGREFVTLRASSADFRIEGRLDAVDGVLEGAMSQGPFEAPIVLRREPAAGEKSS
jgi:hypothetical protein